MSELERLFGKYLNNALFHLMLWAFLGIVYGGIVGPYTWDLLMIVQFGALTTAAMHTLIRYRLKDE